MAVCLGKLTNFLIKVERFLEKCRNRAPSGNRERPAVSY